ncbi:MAG: MATE family efflux transporter [Lachnospiraceae bacterium]|jgi:putative MATE family efflux protein|nr:MATE family efflux transporter [Lachnospiraceae bacterium]
MIQDMTKGNPFRLILLFTIPVFVGNLFQTFYNLVDSVIVGQFLGVNALAAVGGTGSLMFLVLGWVNGMTSGFSILIAQSFGAGDDKRLRHCVVMSVYLCAAMAVVMTGGLLVANESILQVMNTPQEILGDSASYVGVIYAGLAATFAYNMLAGISRALGDSRTPLYFLVLSSALNILLDLLLVAVLPLGVAGAGYATVIAQTVSAVLCFCYIRKRYEVLRITREDRAFSARSAGQLLGIGIPMALQFSITGLGTMVVQASLNLLGASYIAAVSAVNKIQNIVTQLFPSLGVTLATYVGQNVGAGNYRRIRQGVRHSLVLELVFSVAAAVFVYFAGDFFIRLFVQDPTGEIRGIARQMFHIVAWFYPPLGAIFLFRNALQGLGDGLVPMLGGVFELIARVGAIVLLAGPFGFTGICFSDPAAWVSALIPLIPVYFFRMRREERRTVRIR